MSPILKRLHFDKSAILSRPPSPTACSEVSRSIKNVLKFRKRIEKDIARSWVARNRVFLEILAQF